MFAAVVCVGLWVGFHDPRLAELVPIGVGVTAYGVAYAVVHDVYIHRRLRWFGDRRLPLARPARRAPTTCTTASAARRTGCSCRSSRARRALTARAGRGRPTVPELA